MCSEEAYKKMALRQTRGQCWGFNLTGLRACHTTLGCPLPLRHNQHPKLDFADLGRGATGFTTRSDIGPVRAAPNLPDRSVFTIGGSASIGVGRGRGKDFTGDEEEAEDKGYDKNQKFDELEGNDVGLFATTEDDEDDKEAYAIWEDIDGRMDSRRKDCREERLRNTELPTQRVPSSLQF
ncbi:hypothetical protein L7F22_062052 [Adiantum nelumboides]|nr:hypothetical protein [Adiantum nelumboides]